MSKIKNFINILMQTFDQNFPILCDNVSWHHNEGELILDDIGCGEAELCVKAVVHITSNFT